MTTYSDNVKDTFIQNTGSRFDGADNQRLAQQIDNMEQLTPIVQKDNGKYYRESRTSNIYVYRDVYGYLITNPKLNNQIWDSYHKSGLFIISVDQSSLINFSQGTSKHIEFGIKLPWIADKLEKLEKGVPYFHAWRFLKTGLYGGMFVYNPEEEGGDYILKVHT